MDLHDAPDEAEFRTKVREWLEKTLPSLAWPQPDDMVERVPFWQEWQRHLFDAGYAGLTWSQDYGGQGLDERLRAVFSEECDRAGAPERLNIIGEDFCGPTIAHYGTPEQKDKLLRPILTGDEIWCQLFSEPDSGSDLASLRTKATKVEGGYRVTGQKIWTSRAQIAAHAILLARTGGDDPEKARHHGITFFLLPMDSEGITVRPLRHMLGEAEFNEVFLDDVFVPDSAVVGDVDGGWKVAMGTLGFERVAIATGRVNTTKAVRDIIGDIRSRKDATGRPLGADPHVRQQVADLWSRALVHRAISMRVITGADAGGPPGPVTSIGKLYFCPLVEDLADFRLSLEPLGGLFDLDDELSETAAWLRLANQSRGTAIAGGSTFIQRNIVAERILGMPRGSTS
ncbi:alkylation response protein AidB-like acyl-CoA dehydrogenase [Nocardioides sp. BE266]|uniref:acyl-CoA dehydrogenase family protein n=1 Tax=Nocardioides sp. BE266 TaxID=2817725 RepID=UPI00286432B2|nr:acyl-CoA dehydrogenase family protein [Nocardioides sp. BE266]MDR7254244.1 alkylation response protein AidB-like acyl-CoA dehydrogenase [Nocardioides sp. BE266]